MASLGELDGESVFKVVDSESRGHRPLASPPPGWHESGIVSSLKVGFIHEISNQIKANNSDSNKQREREENRGL